MMKYTTTRQRSQADTATDCWENEGGAAASLGGYYGRRIETDRTWTVYHVFSGVPAAVGGSTMTGLSRSDATSGMLSLNRRQGKKGCAPTTSVQP